MKTNRSCAVGIAMGITVLCLASVAIADTANFNLTLTNATMPTQTNVDDFLHLLNTGKNGSGSVTSSGGSETLNFGTVMTGWTWWLDGLYGWQSPLTATFNIGVSLPGTPIAVTKAFSTTGTVTVNCNYVGNYTASIAGFSGTNATVPFTGGSVTMSNIRLTPASTTLRHTSQMTGVFSVAGNYSFNLTDPNMQLVVNSSRINTASAVDDEGTFGFTVSNQANAIVNSLSMDYGDGYVAPVSFSQSSSLKFSTTRSHVYSLDPAEAFRTFDVLISAEGPSDNSSDDDFDQDLLGVTLLRSPRANLILDGSAYASGNILEVRPGQVISFDGSGSLGFTEGAVLKMNGATLLATGSLAGRAHDLLMGSFVVPDVLVGDELLLEYVASNTGTGLNSSSWSIGLQVVPEPATMSLLALGGLAMLKRRRIK